MNSYVSTFVVDWSERGMSTMRTCQKVKRWNQTSWLNRFCSNTSDHGRVYRTEEQTVNCICMCTLVYVSCTCCNFAADYSVDKIKNSAKNVTVVLWPSRYRDKFHYDQHVRLSDVNWQVFWSSCVLYTLSSGNMIQHFYESYIFFYINASNTRFSFIWTLRKINSTFDFILIRKWRNEKKNP